MAMAPEDKRETARLAFILRAQFTDGSRMPEVTENLSSGGVFIQTDQVFRLGDQVPVVLSFPGLLKPVEIVGTVAWTRPATADQRGGVGIRADREEDRQKLAELVRPQGPATAKPSSAVAPAPGAPVAASPKAPGAQDSSAGFGILIVEDNPHIVEMYSYVLKKLATGSKVPVEVHFAADGHAALKLLGEKRVNLVLTDLYMPVMDGFALIERIRTETSTQSIPVVAISGGGNDAQQRAMDLGVDIFLRKPVKFLEVMETVKQLLHIG